MSSKRYDVRRLARQDAAKNLASVARRPFEDEQTRLAMRSLAHFFFLAVQPAQLEKIVDKHPVLLPDDDLPLSTWIDEFLFPEEAQIDLFNYELEAHSA